MNTSTPPENKDDFKQLADSIIKLQTDLTKTIEKHDASISSLTELHKKTESKDKLARDPLVDDKLKKMNEKLTDLEDMYKNAALKIESEKRYKTVDGLAEMLTPDNKDGRKNFDRYKKAKAILEDPHREEYANAFANYLKYSQTAKSSEVKGKMNEVITEIKGSSFDNSESYLKKNLTTITGEQAGYLAPPEFELEITKWLFETSPLRMVATSKMTNRGYYEFPIRGALPTTYWGNTQFGDQATEEQKYQLGKISVQDLHARPSISLNLIEDSVVNIESELRMDLQESFMLAENKAFIQGNGEGVAQPQGLAWYASRSDTTESASKPLQLERLNVAVADFDADTLLNLEAKLLSQYKQNAVWLISRTAKNTIRQFKDTQGQYLFSTAAGWGGFQGVPQIRDGMNGRIIGYPILECDDLDDISSGNNPIYFGDFSKYCILDRLGLTLIRDEVTNKGFIIYWFRKRIGAGFKLAQGVKLLRTT